MSRDFVAMDQRSIRELAQLYDPTVPVHENTAYVARALELRAETEASMTGGRTAYDAGIERAWARPGSRDIEAAEAEAEARAAPAAGKS